METENAFPEVKLLSREADSLLDLVPMLKMIGPIASQFQMLSRLSQG